MENRDFREKINSQKRIEAKRTFLVLFKNNFQKKYGEKIVSVSFSIPLIILIPSTIDPK
jgi:hypothetical protein